MFDPSRLRPSVFSVEDMNKIAAVCDAVMNCPQFKISENGLTVIQPGGGAAVKVFQITEISAGDYVIARTWDGANLSGPDVKIAKQFAFRTSLLAQVIDGTNVTHTFSSDSGRASTVIGGTQNEVLYPRYEVGAEIVCAESQNGTPVEVDDVRISWMDLTSRVWLAID